MDILFSPIAWSFIGGILLFIAILVLFFKNYIKVPSNEVVVFTGLGKTKTVRGGARFRVPGFVRIDRMKLEPFNIEIKLEKAISSEGVPVSVDAVGLVRFGTSEEMMNASIERWLTADRNTLHKQLNDTLSANLRGIVAKMTVEELNKDRESLAKSVIEEAGTALAKIGIEVDNLTIQSISDEGGYLVALGQKRTAEVKRDADIGTAEATRDTKIRSAAARQQGEIAEAQAEASIAEAERDRDIKIAAAKADIDTANAKTAQAGPLAEAEATRAVLVATEQSAAAQIEASTLMEVKRTERERQRLQADVLAPAEADKAAAIARAEGERQSQILAAQADGEAVRQAGQAEADSRKLVAAAVQAEGEAQAAALGARLTAEADGQAKRAAALGQFDENATRLELAPAIMRALVDATSAAASPIAGIDKISIFSGGGDSNGGVIDGITNNTPRLIAGVIQSLESQGISVSSLLGGLDLAALANAGANKVKTTAPVIVTADAETPVVE